MRLATLLTRFAKAQHARLAGQLLRFARAPEPPDAPEGHEEIDLSPEEEEDLDAAWEALEESGELDEEEPEQFRRRGLARQLLRFAKDASGHEHKPAGPGGGQFTSGGAGGPSAPSKTTTNKASATPAKKFGKSKAPVAIGTGYSSLGENEEERTVRRAIKTILGKDGLANIPSLVGAPDDADVMVIPALDENENINDKVIIVMIMREDYEAQRHIAKDNAGNLYIDNIQSRVEPEKQGQGLGADIFGRQVENAIEAGVKYITTHAAASETMNGFYTWPRFGFDAPLTYRHIKDKELLQEVGKRFPDAKTVLDVLKTKDGRDWWKENGDDIEPARFDLAPGSRSLKVLAAYQAERAKRHAKPEPAPEPAPERTYTQGTMFRRRGLASQLQRFAKDASVHEHRPAGEGGGQFTAGASGGGSKEDKPPAKKKEETISPFVQSLVGLRSQLGLPEFEKPKPAPAAKPIKADSLREQLPLDEYGKHRGTKDLGPITLEAHRVGPLADQAGRGGIFFSGDPDSLKPYASLHEGHAVKPYTIAFKNALLAGHQNDLTKLFFKKTYGEMADTYGAKHLGKPAHVRNAAFDKRILAEAKRRGYDGIIYTDPAPPAKTEIAVLNKAGGKIDEGQPAPEEEKKPPPAAAAPGVSDGKLNHKAMADEYSKALGEHVTHHLDNTGRSLFETASGIKLERTLHSPPNGPATVVLAYSFVPEGNRGQGLRSKIAAADAKLFAGHHVRLTGLTPETKHIAEKHGLKASRGSRTFEGIMRPDYAQKPAPEPKPEPERKLTQGTLFVRRGLAAQLLRFQKPPVVRRYRPWREEEYA